MGIENNQKSEKNVSSQAKASITTKRIADSAQALRENLIRRKNRVTEKQGVFSEKD